MNTSTNVKCNVDECKYNESDHCTAETIKVASQAGLMSTCCNASETECSTFKKRD
ncbi:MAG: DUF1540 domain-containing protein [Anaerovoracaceae bacterium]